MTESGTVLLSEGTAAVPPMPSMMSPFEETTLAYVFGVFCIVCIFVVFRYVTMKSEYHERALKHDHDIDRDLARCNDEVMTMVRDAQLDGQVAVQLAEGEQKLG